MGTPCDTSEQTITPILTAGAKDIYIVVKDAAGNVSNSDFRINIPAYASAALCVFTTQPAMRTTVTAGSITGSLTAAATVTPSGTATLTWFICDERGVICSAPLGTGNTFPIPTALPAGTYYYLCQATCAGGADVNSNVAAVTVNATPMTIYTITAAPNNAAYGSVTGGGTYNENAPVTLTATANAGCYFVQWTEGGADAGAANPWRFSAAANRTLVAVFERNAPASDNMITGVTAGERFTRGDTVTFTVTGGGMNNASPHDGDMRWRPDTWAADTNGDFAGELFTQHFSTAGMRPGSYTLRVTFVKQQYSGGAWVNVSPAVTDTKSVGFTVVAEPAPTATPVAGTSGAAQSAALTLPVIEQPAIPATGGNAMPGIGIMLLAGAGLAGSFAIRRKRHG